MSLPQGSTRWVFDSYGTAAVTPAFAGSRLFVGGASVVALDPGTGRVLWESRTEDIADCTPAVVGGTVYATGGDLLALDAETGAVRWRNAPTPEGGLHHVHHVDGLICAGVGLGALRAWDAATGEERWRAKIGENLLAAPRSVDGTLYVSCADGLHALDAATGTHRWSADADGSLITAATVVGDRVFVGMGMSGGSGSLGLRVIDPVSGRTVGHTETPGFVGSAPVFDGRLVYATEASGSVFALDPVTSAQPWRTELDDAGHGLALRHGVLHACGVRSLTALDAASGTPLWSAQPDMFGLGDPLVLDDAVVLCDEVGLIHAVAPPPAR